MLLWILLLLHHWSYLGMQLLNNISSITFCRGQEIFLMRIPKAYSVFKAYYMRTGSTTYDLRLRSIPPFILLNLDCDGEEDKTFPLTVPCLGHSSLCRDYFSFFRVLLIESRPSPYGRVSSPLSLRSSLFAPLLSVERLSPSFSLNARWWEGWSTTHSLSCFGYPIY